MIKNPSASKTQYPYLILFPLGFKYIDVVLENYPIEAYDAIFIPYLDLENLLCKLQSLDLTNRYQIVFLSDFNIFGVSKSMASLVEIIKTFSIDTPCIYTNQSTSTFENLYSPGGTGVIHSHIENLVSTTVPLYSNTRIAREGSFLASDSYSSDFLLSPLYDFQGFFFTVTNAEDTYRQFVLFSLLRKVFFEFGRRLNGCLTFRDLHKLKKELKLDSLELVKYMNFRGGDAECDYFIKKWFLNKDASPYTCFYGREEGGKCDGELFKQIISPHSLRIYHQEPISESFAFQEYDTVYIYQKYPVCSKLRS